MEKRYLIALDARDRVGLVAEIAGRLYDIGGDLDETDFAALAGRARWSGICHLPADLDPPAIIEALASVEGVEPRSVVALDLDADAGMTRAASAATWRLTAEGPDAPGVVARLCETLIDYGGNILRLTSRRIAGLPIRYRVDFVADLQLERVEPCLNALANTAAQLNQSLRAEPVGTDDRSPALNVGAGQS